MANKFCVVCEKNCEFTVEKISISVGREAFPTTAEVCKECESYKMTPKMRREMDQWGLGFTKSVVEYQPLLNETVDRYLEEIAARFNLQKTPLVKILLAFYLKDIVSADTFEGMKKWAQREDTHQYTQTGKREKKLGVGLNYIGYKELGLFCEVWNVAPAKAIEEAISFCVCLLEHGKTVSRLKEIALELEAFVAKSAIAA